MSDPLRPKALAVLREARLTVLHARADDAHRVLEALVQVKSSRQGGPTYAVDLTFGQWSCTCVGSRTRRCAHETAARMVTGHAL